MHIVLVEPEIPGNAGNISRLCAALGFDLHMIKPLGFSVEDKYLKRAGLDYWHLVKVHYHESYQDFAEKYSGYRCYYNSTKAEKFYTEVEFQPEDMLIFGKETAGLPEELLAANQDHCIRIPMCDGARSLNLSNAVAVVAYEAMRQMKFPGLC